MKPTLLRTFLAASALVLLALAAVLPARADYSNTVASFNPVAYWRLNETTAVPPANIVANAGTLGEAGTGFAIPGTALGFAQPGVVGNSITFSNATAGHNAFDPNSIVNVPYNAALNPNGPFTIEFWAKPTSLNRHDGDMLAAVTSMNTSDSRSGWVVYHNTGGGRRGLTTTGNSGLVAQRATPTHLTRQMVQAQQAFGPTSSAFMTELSRCFT
jgi:hypothetical protein